jgi:hypothetical protein
VREFSLHAAYYFEALSPNGRLGCVYLSSNMISLRKYWKLTQKVLTPKLQRIEQDTSLSEFCSCEKLLLATCTCGSKMTCCVRLMQHKLRGSRPIAMTRSMHTLGWLQRCICGVPPINLRPILERPDLACRFCLPRCIPAGSFGSRCLHIKLISIASAYPERP